MESLGFHLFIVISIYQDKAMDRKVETWEEIEELKRSECSLTRKILTNDKLKKIY